MRFARLVAALALVAAAFVWAPVPRAGAAACAAATGVYRGSTPWAQQLFDPARIWPIADGTGQLVAVIGTGIDAANAQFGPGQVLAGVDLLGDGGAASTDCDGRGTFAAGLIAAQRSPSTTFAGLAPGARLLPIRYTQTTGGNATAGAPDQLAAAIDAARTARATVILIVVPAGTDSPALRSAVAAAHAAGAVIVSPAAAAEAGGHTYPTVYPGVIAVGAVNEAGQAVQPEAEPQLALAAPGADLVSTAPAAGGALGHTWPVNDPTFAAAYVAGAAALLRSAEPALTPDQVSAHLTLTADRPAVGGHDPKLGWGTVDPYAAITAQLPAAATGPATTAPAEPVRRIAPAAAPAPPAARDHTGGTVAVIGVLLAAAAGVAAMALRRGRARSWRPGRLE